MSRANPRRSLKCSPGWTDRNPSYIHKGSLPPTPATTTLPTHPPTTLTTARRGKSRSRIVGTPRPLGSNHGYGRYDNSHRYLCRGYVTNHIQNLSNRRNLS